MPPIAAAIIVANGRVLLVRRAVSEGSLSWQFPAGALEDEDAESPENAAVRETREEVGLHVSPGEILGMRVHPNTGRTIIYVVCTPEPDEQPRLLDGEELAEMTWARLADLDSLIPVGIFPPVRQYLASVLH